MFKGLLILISIFAALVYALDSDDNDATSYNYVVTENYHASYDAVSVVEFDGDKKEGFMAVAVEHTGHLPNKTNSPTIPSSFDDEEENETDEITSFFSMKPSVSTPSSPTSSYGDVTRRYNDSYEDELEEDNSSSASANLTNSEVELQEASSSVSPPNSKVEVEESSSSSIRPSLWNSKAKFEEAKADIKKWGENLNCDTSLLGPFRCPMVKKLIEHFFKHAKGDLSRLSTKDLNKLTIRAKVFINKLEKSNVEIDPEMKNLIQKYKKLIEDTMETSV